MAQLEPVGCSDSLVLAESRSGHDVKLAILFAKPYWGRNRSPVLAERGKRNVFLALNGCRNHGHCHAHIVSVRLSYGSPQWLRVQSSRTRARDLKRRCW